jgi:Dolichyl-phosphate-mannose-protein mannosyltransferase
MGENRIGMVDWIWQPAALFAVAWVLNWKLNTVEQYSAADETTILRDVQGFSWRTRRKKFAMSMANDTSEGWNYHPYRFLWSFVLRIASRLSSRKPDYRSLAAVSGLFGALSVPVAYFVASAAGLTGLAPVAAGVLVMVSPIHLGMGRRVLQESAIGFITLLCFWMALKGWTFGLGACLLVGLLWKETTVLGWPSCLWMGVHGSSSWALTVGIFPAALITYLAICRGLLGMRLADWNTIRGWHSEDTPGSYGDYCKGPWHHYLVQFATFSPLVLVGLTAAGSGMGGCFGFGVLLYAGIFSVLRHKNYRYFIVADLGLRILACAIFCGMETWKVVGILSVMVLTDWSVFRKVFLDGCVYDPVPYNVNRALKMEPK